ncbi:ThiF family adenylyltransferase [Agrobacterium vitis]|uniref:ThiF family adenylyltransferase n=1 Tax=Agrobacterium vitis TaxID=373 RepID=UPI0015D9F95B|nr:ThiF family adenylyltransferase [Agrobacterium vitis]
MAMPTDAPSMRAEALEAARRLLEGLSFVALSDDERSTIREGAYPIGWKLAVSFEYGKQHTIAVMLPEGFPYIAPRLAVLDAPPVLSWPHLEEGKLLCVFPPETSVDPENAAGQVKELVHQGVRLIQDILVGKLDIDFEREFTAYWRRGASQGRQEFRSLLEPGGDHRVVWIWRGATIHVVAETENALRDWLINYFGTEKPFVNKLGRTLYLRAKSTIHPIAYPGTAADLSRLFAGDAVALKLITEQAIAGGDRDALITFPTPTGSGFAAVSITPGGPKPPPGKHFVDPMWNGFRKGRMPPDIAAMRATAAASRVNRHKVERVDHDWIHGRDHDPRQAILKNANVLIVGCGSLGSSVAELLARAGVGRLTIMDGEVLDWPNISRHALGADHVGKFKASALSSRLTAAFPHLSGISAIDSQLTTANATQLEGRDLVITTTGTWAVDSLVNEYQRGGVVSTALYTWLEPHAAAAHAVTVPSGGACLRCHISSRGEFAMPVSTWPEGGTVPVPSCGGTFSPYGAAELGFAHALVAEQAIEALASPPKDSRHAVWIGRTARWLNMGGSVGYTWLETVGDPGEGGLVISRPWLVRQGCPVCGGTS